MQYNLFRLTFEMRNSNLNSEQTRTRGFELTRLLET